MNEDSARATERLSCWRRLFPSLTLTFLSVLLLVYILFHALLWYRAVIEVSRSRLGRAHRGSLLACLLSISLSSGRLAVYYVPKQSLSQNSSIVRKLDGHFFTRWFVLSFMPSDAAHSCISLHLLLNPFQARNDLPPKDPDHITRQNQPSTVGYDPQPEQIPRGVMAYV